MKRLINTFLMFFVISLVFILTSGIISYECPFKLLFHISCPGCGLTRAFRALIHFDLYTAFNYNILAIPLFIIGIITIVCMIIDTFKNNNKTIIYIFKILKKGYAVILFFVVLSMFINNIRGI